RHRRQAEREADFGQGTGTFQDRRSGTLLPLQRRDNYQSEDKPGGNETMTKTMSIRMDQDNVDFVNKLSKAEKGDVSKTVRDLVYKGRVMLAIDKYKKGQVSLAKPRNSQAFRWAT